MFNMNILGSLEPLSISVSRPDGSLLGCIDDIIDEQSASLSIGINEQYTLAFNVTSNNSPWGEYLQEGMYLFVDKVGLFKMVQPQIVLDGIKEVISITAYSCDSELEDKTCGLSINMGTKESMEYLVTYNANEDEELVNPYTDVPYDWILLYNTLPQQLTKFRTLYNNRHFGNPDSKGETVVTNSSLIEELTKMFTLVPRLKNKIKYVGNDSVLTEYVITKYSGDNVSSYTLLSNFGSRISTLITYYTNYRSQLSLLDLVLEETGGAWTVGDISGLASGDYSLANSKYQFEINETIYSFLTNTFATITNCVVNFDILNRRVNITRVEEIGDDTGIVIGYDTLVKTLNIQTDEDKLATRLRVFGGDNLDISRVNFGSQYVYDLSYKMNTRDNNGNRVYVTDALAAKYDTYVDYLEQQRTRYISLSKSYEEYNKEIDEIRYRVPNDGLKIDWGTYHQDELAESLKQFKNELAALKSLYKNDYYAQGVNADGSINENFMKTTMYWYDYQAFKTIIDQIECAIAVYPNYSDQTFWTETQIAQYKDAISAWETDWSLFGSNELKAKIDAYKQNMDLLAEESVIRVSEGSYAIKTWEQLSDAEKAEFGDDETQYKYDSYMTYYNYMNDAQTYLNSLLSQIASLESQRDSTQTQRNTIVKNVALDSYFTADECKTIYRLFRDSDYTNENIVTTSIDTVSEKLDHMVELLEDAKDKVSETSRPQVTFTVESDNLFAIPEFEPMWNSFHPGNYIHVQYKDKTYVKVRLIGYTFNPRLVSSDQFSMTFSNFTQSRSYYRDWASLLNNASGSSGSYSASGVRGGDIDDAITNTLLAKLLNSETFGTRVTDVILDTIDVNVITARVAKFGGLANGTTIIDGKCVKTGYIIDWLYNGVNGGITNTKGSIINLETGKFNFGGGNLVYDGDALAVKGAFTANTLSAGGKTYASHNHDGLFIDLNGNIYAGAGSQTKIYANGTFDLCNGKFIWDGSTLSIDNKLSWRSSDSTLTVKGILKADTGYIGGEDGWTIVANKLYSGVLGAANGMYFGTVDLGNATIAGHQDTKWRFAIGSKFGVLNDGTLYGNDAHLTGDITARSLDLTTYGVKVDTDDISGLAAIATSGNIDDLGGKNTILYKGDVTFSEEEIDPKTGVKKVISSWIDSNGVTHTNTTYTSPNGKYVLCDVGMGTYGSGTTGYILSTDGLLKASNAIIYGTIYANAGQIGDCHIENGVLEIGTNNVTDLPDTLRSIQEDMEDIEKDLQEQIDGKIETWTQQTDPSTSWPNDELEAHNGDLWLYTGLSDTTVGGVSIHPQGVYKYNYSTKKWVAYSSNSQNLFDLADSKKHIFYGSPSGTYADKEIGDYLVDSSDGKTYRWDGSKWVNVTDYNTAISEAIDELEGDLVKQIDAKVETWAQNTNPATSWTTAELKKQHDNDLWYYTGITDLTVDGVTIKPSKTYQYSQSTNKWSVYNSPSTSLFDLVDGKTTIYYGSPSGTYADKEIGDYLVDSSDGKTYRWDGSKWVNVTDYNADIQDAINSLALIARTGDANDLNGIEHGNNLCDVSVSKTDEQNQRVYAKWVKYNNQYVHFSGTQSTSLTSPALLTVLKACDFKTTDYITLSFDYAKYSGSSNYTVYAVLNYYNANGSVLSSYVTSKSFTLSTSDDDNWNISVDLPFSSKPSTAVYYSVGLYSSSSYPLYYYMFKNLEILKGVGGFIADNNGIRIGTADSKLAGAITLSSNKDFSREINGNQRDYLRFAIGNKFAVGSEGKLYATDAYFDGNGYFAGEVQTNTGKIGGFSIANGKIYTSNYSLGSDNGVHIGSSSLGSANINGSGNLSTWRLVIGSKFGVTSNGTLYASAGRIGSLTIGEIEIGVGKISDIETTANSAASAATDAAKVATNYLTKIDNNGIKVHAINNTSSNYIQINADGLNVYKGNESFAAFGSTIRVGSINGRNILFNSSYINIRNKSTVLAQFGDTVTIGNSSAYNIKIDSSYVYIKNGSTQYAKFGSTSVIGNDSNNISISSGTISMRYSSVDVGNISYANDANNTNALGFSMALKRSTGTKKPSYVGLTAYASDGSVYYRWIYAQDNSSISGIKAGCLNSGADICMQNYKIYFDGGTYYLKYGLNNGYCLETNANISIEKTGTNNYASIRVFRSDTGHSLSLQIGAGGTNKGLYDDSGGNWLIYLDNDDNLFLGSNMYGGKLHLLNNVTHVALGKNSNAFVPNEDNKTTLGTSSYLWKQVYAKNSTISTSDEKEKDIINKLDQYANTLIMSLEPIDFMWKDGDHRRIRMGFSAQHTSKICKSIDKNLALVTASYKAKGDSEVPDKEYFGEEVDDNLLTWGMNQTELIAPIIKVLQLQDKRIKELEEIIRSK